MLGISVIAIGKFSGAIHDIRDQYFNDNASSAQHTSIDIDKLASEVQFRLQNNGLSLTRVPGTSTSILEYLDIIAYEADALSKVWVEIAADFESGLTIDYAKFKAIVTQHNISEAPNEGYFSRLFAFYRLLPEIQNENINGTWMSDFYHSIEISILMRSNLLDDFHHISSEIINPGFFNDDNSIEELRDFRSSVTALQKEAASIGALAKAIRVKIENKSVR